MYKSYNPKKHNRKSIRLKGYDYTQSGLYFITLMTENRAQLFGDIKHGKMILNDAGRIANECWMNIPQHFPNVVLHEYIIMPNHIHGIIELTTMAVGTNKNSPNNIPNDHPMMGTNDHPMMGTNDHPMMGTNDHPMMGTNDNPMMGTNDHPMVGTNDHPMVWPNKYSPNTGANDHSPLPRSPSRTIGSVIRGYKIGVTKWFRQNTDIQSVWQRNYYEQIIRDEISYYRITKYIVNNPIKWNGERGK
jgi:REP element-mobilizing transposase RayT